MKRKNPDIHTTVIALYHRLHLILHIPDLSIMFSLDV